MDKKRSFFTSSSTCHDPLQNKIIGHVLGQEKVPLPVLQHISLVHRVLGEIEHLHHYVLIQLIVLEHGLLPHAQSSTKGTQRRRGCWQVVPVRVVAATYPAADAITSARCDGAARGRGCRWLNLDWRQKNLHL